MLLYTVDLGGGIGTAACATIVVGAATVLVVVSQCAGETG